jgi:hypothetical protein
LIPALSLFTILKLARLLAGQEGSTSTFFEAVPVLEPAFSK